MKSKSMILMIVAMACGLAAAYTTAKLTAKGNDEVESVLVATSEIKIGTVIKEPEKLFVVSEYKKGTAPGAVTEIEKLKDKIVTRTIRPGNFVNIEDLSTNFGINPPKGTKAMAIKVTADAAVGGFIMPGSRVDVLATITEQHDRPEVMTVLQNQEVLAVDKISVRPDGQSAVDTINNVTLAVTPHNAQKLELALRKSGGVVRLLLRDQNDNAISRLLSTKSLSDVAVEFGPGNGDGTIVRALAATRDLPPGTVIDDPAKLFTAVPVAVMPERGYSEADLAKLQGQTLTAPLFKDSFATMKHFGAEGVKPAGTGSQGETVRSVLFIQNGGKEPQMITYQDGLMVTGESSTPKASTPDHTEKTPPAKDKSSQPS